MTRNIFIAALALLTPNIAHAEAGPTVYKTFGTWGVIKDEKYCVAMRRYEAGHTLYVAFKPEDDTVAVSLADPYATSLKEGQEIKLHVFFMGAGKLDDGWGLWDFTVRKNAETPVMMGAFNARDMLRDIARNDIIAFSIDEKASRLVGSFALDGSAAAVAALRQCSFEVAGLNPDDPFLR